MKERPEVMRVITSEKRGGREKEAWMRDRKTGASKVLVTFYFLN